MFAFICGPHFASLVGLVPPNPPSESGARIDHWQGRQPGRLVCLAAHHQVRLSVVACFIAAWPSEFLPLSSERAERRTRVENGLLRRGRYTKLAWPLRSRDLLW